jgi:protein ImuB
MATPVRTVVVWCPDWPVTAAGIGPDTPAAVFSANRVVACSAAARAEGVRRGHRRREAQSRCPELVVLGHDTDRDAREYEPVVSVVEALAPGVAVVAPGMLALRAKGPARYFGGDAQVVELLAAEVGVRLIEHGTVQVGVADGLFAAILAARGGVVVPAGTSPEFLAPQPVATLQLAGAAGAGAGRDALVDLLRRLGLHTLGDFAALPATDVASRFDADGVLAHRLARGIEPYPVLGRQIPVDLEVDLVLDPPAEQVERAAFATRSLVERLQERLAGHGLACTRVVVTARTAAGEEHSRAWRGDGALTSPAIADRVRWQLDGWLSGRAAHRPTAGVSLLRLTAEEVVEYRGLQLTLWGGWADSDARAHRALSRVQGMLGPEAVLTPVLGGGRGPAERVRLVPWQDERAPTSPADQPWPGQLPGPYPTTVLTPPEPVEVRDATGTPVTVSARQILSAAPATLRRRGTPQPVRSWAGPWLVDQHWWDSRAARRLARLQVVVGPGGDDESALLLISEAGTWAVEGEYG